ncbi:hypothetical protein O181_122011, partial [Austropuccinia psidii MF-1]|nr:hypothetical protein [Austropuccinia psidii MF-1]
MTTRRSLSMRLCMCQHFSTQHTLPLRVIGTELPSHLSNINSTLKISTEPLHPNSLQKSLLVQQEL